MVGGQGSEGTGFHLRATQARAEQAARGLPKFKLVFFVEDDGKPLVRDWLRSLSLTKKQALGTAMREVLQELGIGVCGTEFGKQLGKGVFEFRLRQKPGEVRSGKGTKLPPEEILLRVWCEERSIHQQHAGWIRTLPAWVPDDVSRLG